jgi:uncharacterized 2Fe-2S/4Fe-4S cluster protein (DUF4445 family)
VQVLSGKCSTCKPEESALEPNLLTQGYSLACRSLVEDDITVKIPESSLFQSQTKILLRDAGSTSVPAPADRSGRYGVAFDVGTTTIVGSLMDIGTGAELAVVGAVNPQTSFGDDVLSRIKKCREDENGLSMLHESVISTVNSITGQLAHKADTGAEAIVEAVFAGNTAMQEILCNIDPSALGEIPFAAAFTDPLRRKASDLGLAINVDADVYIFPQIGSFIGGDTVAGIIATRLDRLSEPALFVDVGTNGELVLQHDGLMLAASTAAGPAFEGARITNGMRATDGAIEKVLIRDNVTLNLIGNRRPRGICGSGLIDAAAELLKVGVIDSTGRILEPDELPDNMPDAVRSRVRECAGKQTFVLVESDESETGSPICLYQKDIRELQLANGAIRAGISILLSMQGLQPADLKTVFLAGAFGNFIRRSNAKRIGMLPELHNDRIRFVGNTAAMGAGLALMSQDEKEYAARVARTTRHVDLSLNTDFQTEFSNAMIFPESP